MYMYIYIYVYIYFMYIYHLVSNIYFIYNQCIQSLQAKGFQITC